MKAKTGKRYSEKKKNEILAFIYSKGRGGAAAAQRKFGVTYSTLRYWLKGSVSGRRSGRVKSVKDFRRVAKNGLKALRALEKQLKALQQSLMLLRR